MSTDSNTKSTIHDVVVVVVGAGMAGVSCARNLVSQGLKPSEVVLLEARERVGGRTWSVPFENAVVDMGGSWIHGVKGNPLTSLTKHFNLKLGRRETWSKGLLLNTAGEDMLEDYDLLEEYLDEFKEELQYRAELIPEKSKSASTDVSVWTMVNAMLLHAGVPPAYLYQKPHQSSSSSTTAPKLSFPTLEAVPSQKQKAKKKFGGIHNLLDNIGIQSNASAEDGEDDEEKEDGKEDTAVATSSYPEKTKSQKVSVAEILKRHKITPQRFQQCLKVWVNEFEGYMASTLEQLSFQWMYDEEEEIEYGGDRMMLNGYSSLIDHLIKQDPPLQVVTSSPVTSITATPLPLASTSSKGEQKQQQSSDRVSASEKASYDSVTITTQSGQRYRAQFVVVTIPIGVLRSENKLKGDIIFDPPLPLWKRDACNRMGFGLLDKVVLAFDQIFWDTTLQYILVDAHDAHDSFLFLPYNRYFPKAPVLVALVHNENATRLEAMTDQQVCDEALKVLGTRFTNDLVRKHFVRGTMSRWQQDTYARGSYTAVWVGGSAVDYDIIAKPICGGRVRFAGESTNRAYPCTVHGAHLSGVREANSITKTLRKRRLK